MPPYVCVHVCVCVCVPECSEVTNSMSACTEPAISTPSFRRSWSYAAGQVCVFVCVYVCSEGDKQSTLRYCLCAVCE